MAKTDVIRVTNLLVNTDNYRFDTVDGQKEAIDRMIIDQGDKLFNLAEHIIAHGLNPNDPIQVAVSHHDKTKYNVLEGNRRAVSLKLLNQPNLLDGHSGTLKKKFKKLHDEQGAKIPKNIQCTVYKDPKDADVWIGVKHGYGKSGIGTDGWDPIQKGRFESQIEGKTSIVVQTVNFLKTSSEISPEVKKNIGKLKVSSLQRLINDPDVRDFAGIDVENGILKSSRAESEVARVLDKIARDLLDPNFKVAEIYTKQDRSDYVEGFDKKMLPNKKKTTATWELGNSTGKSTSAAKKTKPISKDRDYVIPKSCALSIGIPKINSIYHELQCLPVSKFANAAAIELRSFVEFSMDAYIESNKITQAKDGSSLDSNSKLIKKMSEVANHMETNLFADKKLCKGIRNAASNKNDLLGIETLHAYVHNPNFSPIPKNLVITWDNIQPFMERLWSNI